MFSMHPSWSKIWKYLRDKGVMKFWLKITYAFLLERSLQFFISWLSFKKKTPKIPISKYKLFFPYSRLLLTIFRVIGYHWGYSSFVLACMLASKSTSGKKIALDHHRTFLYERWNSGAPLCSCCSQGRITWSEMISYRCMFVFLLLIYINRSLLSRIFSYCML